MSPEIRLPQVLRGVFFEGRWDREKVWRLPTATTQCDPCDFLWLLDLPMWSTVPGEPRFDLAPADVLRRLDAYPRHALRIHEADLAYPLDAFHNGSAWVVIDGYHRLCRHILEGSPTAPVRLHPETCWAEVRVG